MPRREAVVSWSRKGRRHVGFLGNAQIQGEIDRTEGEALRTARFGDGDHVRDSARALDQRDHGLARMSRDVLDILRTLRLCQHDGSDRIEAAQVEVRSEPWRVDGVDANQHLRRRRQPFPERPARITLAIGRYRIFEIHDHRICADSACLRITVGTICRHEQIRTGDG